MYKNCPVCNGSMYLRGNFVWHCGWHGGEFLATDDEVKAAKRDLGFRFNRRIGMRLRKWKLSIEH